jgi:hypothetical protein
LQLWDEGLAHLAGQLFGPCGVNAFVSADGGMRRRSGRAPPSTRASAERTQGIHRIDDDPNDTLALRPARDPRSDPPGPPPALVSSSLVS